MSAWRPRLHSTGQAALLLTITGHENGIGHARPRHFYWNASFRNQHAWPPAGRPWDVFWRPQGREQRSIILPESERVAAQPMRRPLGQPRSVQRIFLAQRRGGEADRI